jgi:type II secretory pathway pseudopilin PulG
MGRKRVERRIGGYILLETAIAVLILGIIGSLMFPLLSTMLEYERNKRTADHQEQIIRALTGYVMIHRRLPPPDRPGSINQSRSCRGNQCVGIVPYRALGLPEKTAKDGNHRWFTYAVHEMMTNGGDVVHRYSPHNQTSVISGAHYISLKDLTTGNLIQEDTSNPIMFLLIHHGPSGGGAFHENGEEKIPTDNIHEAINAANDLNFVSGSGNGFNHQVTWVCKNHLPNANSIHNPSTQGITQTRLGTPHQRERDSDDTHRHPHFGTSHQRESNHGS